MKRCILTICLILVCVLSVGSNIAFACNELPEPGIHNAYYQYICIGQPAQFSGYDSYDPDNGEPQGEGNGIDDYYWDYDDYSGWHNDGQTPSHTFSSIGYYYVQLKVKDDDDPQGESSWYDTCWVIVSEVDEIVNEDYENGTQFVPIGGGINLYANSNPCIPHPDPDEVYYFPSGSPTWSVESHPYGANPSLSPWGTQYCVGGGNDAAYLSGLTVPGDYVIRAKCGSSDSGDTITVTAVEVEITYVPIYTCFAYYGQDAPSCLAVAQGNPSGGTYTWSFTSAGGNINFLGGQNSDTLSFRGTSPGNVTLKITYTKGGVQFYDTETVKVRRMSTTDSHRGDLTLALNYYKVKYYHRLKDQYGEYIDVLGIPCEENLTVIYGETGEEGAGNTDYYGSDGAWNGGICVRDYLKYPSNTEDSKVDQTLKAGGWTTSPYYFIWFDTAGDYILWKTTH